MLVLLIWRSATTPTSTYCPCSSYGEVLLDEEDRSAGSQAIVDLLLIPDEAATRHRRRFEIIGGIIIVVLLLRCWLS